MHLDDHKVFLPGQRGNPLGVSGCLRISTKEYDPAKARRFCQAADRWSTYLELWGHAIELTRREAQIFVRYTPGWVLDDRVVALSVLAADGTAQIHAHPDALRAAARRYRGQPLVLGAYLHSMAVHELAHVDGRMGHGHTREYAEARVALAGRTERVVPRLAGLAIDSLGCAPLGACWQRPTMVARLACQEELRQARGAVCEATSADCRECGTCPVI